MRAIITVIGKDNVGIVARIATEFAKLNLNILDINQTIMEEFFTMVLMVDLNKANKQFDEIKKDLTSVGKELGLDVKIQNEEIFNLMHTI